MNIWNETKVAIYRSGVLHLNASDQRNKCTANNSKVNQNWFSTVLKNQFTWFVLGSYGTTVVRPLMAWSIRPRIGIPCCNNCCSNPTSASAFRPRTDSAKFMLRPWTNSLLRISADKQKRTLTFSIISFRRREACFTISIFVQMNIVPLFTQMYCCQWSNLWHILTKNTDERYHFWRVHW